jgi:hypothetical protein
MASVAERHLRPIAGPEMRELTPVPERLLRRLWVAVAGSVTFLAVAVVQGVLRAGYDSWHQAISALSLGHGGWIQAANFVCFGAMVASTAPTWRRLLAGGRGAVSYPAQTLGLGCALMAAGCVPQDPAPGYDPEGLALAGPTARGLLHIVIAGVAAGCSVAGLFVMAGRFRGEQAWDGWALYSRLVAVLVIVSVAIYGVWSVRPSGFAGTFERLAVALPLVWLVTFLRRLGAGVPIMVTVRE